MSPAEIERLKREIARELRSTFDVVSELHTESGDVDNRLDFGRYGGRLSLRSGAGPIVSLSVVRTHYLPRADGFEGQSTNVTAGVKTALSDTADGLFELGMTLFSSDTPTVNVLGALTVEVDDGTSLHFGGSRLNVEESLLSATGLRPIRGPFAGELAGRVMENRVTAGVVHRLPYDTDVFGEGGFGNRDGSSIESNPFRHLRAGAGVNLVANAVEPAVSLLRASYHFNYFGFATNRLGFGGASMQNRRGQPIAPRVLGSDGTSPFPTRTRPGVGGYFSPELFVSHVGRLDVQGLVHRDIAYSVGGFFGVQRYDRVPTHPLAGVSATAEFILNERYSLPITFQMDNSGPFKQQSTLANLRITF